MSIVCFAFAPWDAGKFRFTLLLKKNESETYKKHQAPTPLHT